MYLSRFLIGLFTILCALTTKSHAFVGHYLVDRKISRIVRTNKACMRRYKYIRSFHVERRRNSCILASSNSNNNGMKKTLMFRKVITLYAPMWTTLAAVFGIKYSAIVSPVLGSLHVMQTSLAFLMLAMGLTITPNDLARAVKNPLVLLTNAIYCFGMMPLVAFGISKLFSYNTSEAAGIILLGSVSGGQASNLFTLLADGDVALSVICTFSTTILGAIATPILVKLLLGCSVNINIFAILKTVMNLALLPLLLGLSFGRFAPHAVVDLCPLFGVLATLILVCGGASNSAASLAFDQSVAMKASCLLPIVGGALAFALCSKSKMTEKKKRALVIETLSKSPTLAYVLAIKHFDAKTTAAIPAAAMVSLAVIGALVASIWSSVWPINNEV